MPRHKTDVIQDIMLECPRCQGTGILGQRNGVDQSCPACGGEGRVDSHDLRTYQNREERRYASYAEDPTFIAPGRETTSLNLSRLVATAQQTEVALAGNTPTGANPDVSPGRVLVVPIPGGTEQRFAVVGGFEALAAAMRRGGNAPVEVVANETHRLVADAVDLTTFAEGQTDR